MAYKILVINPGSTSTKIAAYEDERLVFTESIVHDEEKIRAFDSIPAQLPYRMEVLHKTLEEHNYDINDLSAVIGRGGMVPGLHTGGYSVNDALAQALSTDIASPHASNLGGLMAREIAKPLGIPSYIYDAVTSGELPPVATVTGIPDITRQSCCHVLNSRAMAMKYASSQGKRYEDMNVIVAHLGGGVSSSAHQKGKIIDSVGDDDGHFSPERSGSVPELLLVDLCYTGQYTKQEMKQKIRGKGGMYAHLGTSDCREIEKMIENGDKHAELVFHAQAYQISKGIGLLSITLSGDVDAIILTGGVANSKKLTGLIAGYVGWIAPVVVMPGENEMESLALGALRMLKGEEMPNEYTLPDELK